MRAFGGASVRDHLLARYRNAFAAIVLKQLQSKGFRDGMQARRWAITYKIHLIGRRTSTLGRCAVQRCRAKALRQASSSRGNIGLSVSAPSAIWQ